MEDTPLRKPAAGAQDDGTSQILCTPISFDSSDGASRISGYIWQGAGSKPKAIVQIVHGMAEHVRRYDEFTRFLAAHGYAAIAHDQLGHGASSSKEAWGVFDTKQGKEHLLGDIDTARKLAAKELGALPHFIFGHSMGSYLTRVYIARTGAGLSGAVICGTGHVAPAVSKAGNALARLICKMKGPEHVSALLESMGVGAYADAVEGDDELAWLSHDAGNVERYRADEACGFAFSASGYAMLTSLTGEACSAKSARNIPHDLPIYLIAGDDDPVGACGKGVKRCRRMMRNAGVADVEMRIYPQMRHEILNEDRREDVFEDVCSWLESKCKGQPATGAGKGDAR